MIAITIAIAIAIIWAMVSVDNMVHIRCNIIILYMEADLNWHKQIKFISSYIQ